MTNEELNAKIASLKSFEDVYAMMQENGYSGTMEDFKTLTAQAAKDMEAMDIDDMDAVAGGFGMEDIKDGAIKAYDVTKDALVKAWDVTSDAAVKGWNWVKANPGKTFDMVGSVALAAVAITLAVKWHPENEPAAAGGNEPLRESLSSIKDFVPPQI